MIVTSDDGSHTLQVAALKEHYHSHKGALRESMHVFIETGLRQFSGNGVIHLLEVGFGTGLNALLTMLHRGQMNISYTGLEAFPLARSITDRLNYPTMTGDDRAPALFSAVHDAPWGEPVEIIPGFWLLKKEQRFQDFETTQVFDLVYFDAFAPHAQPELWEQPVWEKLHAMMCPGGVLVTYCAKGQVRRDMQAAGFTVERLAGPPGKREMIRARKNNE